MQRATTSTIPIKGKLGDIVAYSEVAIRNNIAAVEYCRTSIAAISGSAAGTILSMEYNLFHSMAMICIISSAFRHSRPKWTDRFPLLCGVCGGNVAVNYD